MKVKSKDFVSTLRGAFSTHPTLDTLWAWLLGDVVPSEREAGVLIDHFRSYGLEVSPRDFVRGTAASNNPIFIHLRLLRRSLDRSDLTHFLNTLAAPQLKGFSDAEFQI